MAGLPSFFFTLFKKFQVLDHVPQKQFHGVAASPHGNFNLTDPAAANSVFGSSMHGTLLAPGDLTPGNNPLWAALNGRTMHPPFTPITIPAGPQMGQTWPAMPGFNTDGTETLGWQTFQLNATSPFKVVDVFATWIAGGKVNDVPTTVIAARPPTMTTGLDAGVVTPFVCSMAGDTGVRPGVPSNFWATSLVYLLDPGTGSIVMPNTLTAGSEYLLAAVVGNRGALDGGRFINNNPLQIQAGASVMVWNTFDSPGVELPALSNLDVTDKNNIYEQFFLWAGNYDVVGFRLNVQTVFDGIIAALTDAVNNDGLDLGGVTPETWVLTQPAHLCAKVAIRMQGDNFPDAGTTPDQDARVAQKNLAPFDVNIATSTTNPNINWKNFMVGQPLFFRLNQGEGRNTLVFQPRVESPENFRFFLAVPRATFDRFFGEKRGGSMKGWRVVSEKRICNGVLGEKAKPFPDAVILQLTGKENAIELPALPERLYLALSLGIEYVTKGLKAGDLGELTFAQQTLLPVLKRGTHCLDIEKRTVGGFTLLLRGHDARHPHHGKPDVKAKAKTTPAAKSKAKPPARRSR